MDILQGLNTLFPLNSVGGTELYIGGIIVVYKDDVRNFHYVTIRRIYIKNLCDKI